MANLKSKSQEKAEREGIKKWWMPLFGMVIALTLAVVALALAPSARSLWWNAATQLRDMNTKLVGPNVSVCRLGTAEPCWGVVDVGVALVVWLIVFGVAMMIVIALVGGETKEDKYSKSVMQDAESRKKASRRAKKRGTVGRTRRR
ncbi:MAG: hypothetical protein JXB47_07580 [Anaerolineae bacterium]|nr:hypothetical protein [Anaerolineae bacterium]